MGKRTSNGGAIERGQDRPEAWKAKNGHTDRLDWSASEVRKIVNPVTCGITLESSIGPEFLVGRSQGIDDLVYIVHSISLFEMKKQKRKQSKLGCISYGRSQRERLTWPAQAKRLNLGPQIGTSP